LGACHRASLTRDDFVWLTGSLCQLNRIPFDAALLLQRFSAPHSVRQFIEAAQSLGFRTGEARLSGASYPCVGFLDADSPKPAILAKADAERVLYFEAGSSTPATVPAAEARERFAPL